MDITVYAGFPPHDDLSTEVTADGATVKELTHDVGGGRPVTVTDPDGNVAGPLQDR